ncbi:hypothetical protein CK203_079254 [Vitis vinifera]|uniref:Uncharacterized protein n=1 Tax=Vitis vinifera TaxID=29760 RepID=A0A438FBC7_VITVI|nr:hypothetical protein CK203_079254 [Vitis vinifera]
MCQEKGAIGTVPGWEMGRGFGFRSKPNKAEQTKFYSEVPDVLRIQCYTWKGVTQKWGVLKVVNNIRMFG